MRAILEEDGGPKSDYVKVGIPTSSEPTNTPGIARKLEKIRHLRSIYKNKNKA
jgi:hypothetical protein